MLLTLKFFKISGQRLTAILSLSRKAWDQVASASPAATTTSTLPQDAIDK